MAYCAVQYIYCQIVFESSPMSHDKYTSVTSICLTAMLIANVEQTEAERGYHVGDDVTQCDIKPDISRLLSN